MRGAKKDLPWGIPRGRSFCYMESFGGRKILLADTA